MRRGDVDALTLTFLAALGDRRDPIEPEYAAAYVAASALADLVIDIHAIRRLLTPKE